MNNFRFKLDRKGVRALLQSEEMMGVCQEHAQQIAKRAGEGYEVTTHTGRTRVNASVKPLTREAWVDNMQNNSLLKAVR